MDKHHSISVIDSDCRCAPFLGLWSPNVFARAGNHANTLDKRFIFAFPVIEIIALAVDDFYSRHIGTAPVKSKNRHVLGESRIIYVSSRAHQ